MEDLNSLHRHAVNLKNICLDTIQPQFILSYMKEAVKIGFKLL